MQYFLQKFLINTYMYFCPKYRHVLQGKKEKTVDYMRLRKKCKMKACVLSQFIDTEDAVIVRA